MQFEVRLVHAEAGHRVVEARALEQGLLLGSALGEATTAEAAEERALDRLCRRLGIALPAMGTQAEAAIASAEPSGGVRLPSAEMANARQAARRTPAPTAAARENSGSAATPTLPSLGPIQPRELEPEDASPSDPEDWSAELTRLDLALRRIGWGREQEGTYLSRAFGHPSRSRLTRYADLLAYLRRLESLESGADPLLAPLPLRRRDLLEQGDQLLSQLGWDGERARAFSEVQLGVRSRRQLGDEQLLQFNRLLESELLQGAGLQTADPAA